MENVKSNVIYVVSKSNTASKGDGTSWKTGYTDLNQALQAARTGDQIWVKEGVYTPTTTDDRTKTFQLKDGVTVLGGFKGNETSASQRDFNNNPTVLSGDIGKQGDNSDNSLHVVTLANNSVLDGVRVKDGNAIPGHPAPNDTVGDSPHPSGNVALAPGKTVPGSSTSLPANNAMVEPPPNLTPDQIVNGNGDGAGGGILNLRTNGTVKNSIIENNTAIKGGGIYNVGEGSNGGATYDNVTVRNNTAQIRGGGISNDAASVKLANSSVLNNSVNSHGQQVGKGGGIYSDLGSAVKGKGLEIYNTRVSGNSSDGSGGGIANDGGYSPIIYGSTITGNRAQDEGGGIYNGTGESDNPKIINTDVHGNTAVTGGPNLYNWNDDTPNIQNSSIRGVTNSAVTGSIGADLKNPISENQTKAIYNQNPRIPSSTSSEGPNPNSNRGLQPTPTTVVDANGNQRVVYVSKTATDNGDGKSWKTAYNNLGAGIKDADKDGAQVWATSGTYTPDGKGRDATFNLNNGASIHGGFSGNETSLDQRNLNAAPTVLSGQLGNGGKRNNAYHVVSASGSKPVGLDDVTIANGNANGQGFNGHGGGLINTENKPQGRPDFETGTSVNASNVTFKNNSAEDGGAAYLYGQSNSTFNNVSFDSNHAQNGGAVTQRVSANATFNNAQFTNNKATYNGGASYVDYGSQVTFNKGSSFNHNQAGVDGGGVYSVTRAAQVGQTGASFNGVQFNNNSAGRNGGAADLHDQSSGNFINTVFNNNRDKQGRGNGVAATGGGTATINGKSINSQPLQSPAGSTTSNNKPLVGKSNTQPLTTSRPGTLHI